MLDYGFNFINTKIYIDNESTICIVKNPVFHSKTKHIEIRHHFIRDSYEKKLIQVIKIHTDHNVADLLTKAFNVIRFNFLIAALDYLVSDDVFDMVWKWPKPHSTFSQSTMANLEFYDIHNMVVYLLKTEGSEGFYQIVYFLNSCHIKYALTKNPTIYTSLIQQFWQTVAANTLDTREVQITATIHGKVKLVFEASIRRHLKLEDSNGISTLPNTEIFEQLALMSPKKTSWEQFSSNIATAIILLATNKTFNFLKMIFEGMLKKLDRSTVSVESHHTPLGSLTTSQPSFSSPSRIPIRQETKVPQPSSLTHTHVADEAASTGVDVRHRGAATTVSSLDVGQGSGNIDKTLSMHHDSPLLRVKTLGSDECSITLNELTVLCTKLSQKVKSLETDLKQTKKVYGVAYTKLIMKVKKLEKTIKPSQVKRRAKIVVSDDKELKDHFKQGRREAQSQESQDEDQLGVFSAANVLAEVAKVHTYTRRRRTICTASGGISTAEESFSTADASMPVSTAGMVDKGKVIMQEFELELTTTMLQQRQERAGYEATLWSLVKERFSIIEPTDNKEKELWVELKRLFKPDVDDTLWKLQRFLGSFFVLWFMANDRQRNFSTNEDLTQKVSHSILVTNFPESVTPRDLWRVCGTYGTVVDVFIPVKRSKAGKRFAFVRFIKVINLDRLVKNLCTLWIGNYHLYANQVRFERSRINQFPPLNGSSRVSENQGLRQPHGSYAKVVNATSLMQWGSFSDWNLWFSTIRLKSKVKSLLAGVFNVAWWSIWVFRNRVVFYGSTPSRSLIFDDIVDNSFHWSFYRCNRVFSWEDCCGGVFVVAAVVSLCCCGGCVVACLLLTVVIVECLEDDTENVPLTYHLEGRIPFRRRVFNSAMDGHTKTAKMLEDKIKSKEFMTMNHNDVVSLCFLAVVEFVLLGEEPRHNVPEWCLRLVDDRDRWNLHPWGLYVWATLYYSLRNSNVRRWPVFYATPVEEDVDKHKYTLRDFTCLSRLGYWSRSEYMRFNFSHVMNVILEQLLGVPMESFFIHTRTFFVDARPTPRLTLNAVEDRSLSTFGGTSKDLEAVKEKGKAYKGMYNQMKTFMEMKKALRETLEEKARAEKEWEERIKQEQDHDDLFGLEFGVKSDSEYESD
uniref:RNA-directed DNA polymerase, eukaryota, nucleotide-binding alpha-beta plait domain protein n=1 Tax=Tanacetum cinerariifolium TaxID=118510 RepID=A0A6L2NAM0_TANCI|nr:RNA-directed DNA polymerase, eukaryota, nucleotide-binding alpha-beta plait domain protein [Tanacetum cinerariifolium]